MNAAAASTRWALVRPLAVLGIATAVAGAGTFGWAAVEQPLPPLVGAQGTPASPVPPVPSDAAATAPIAATPIPSFATADIPEAGTEAAETVPIPVPTVALPPPINQLPAPTVAAPTAPAPTPVPVTPAATVEAAESAGAGRTAVVATDVLNVRAEPGLAGEIVATLAAGERVAVLAGPVTVDELAWYRLGAAGVVGWSAADYLLLDELRSDLAAPAALLARILPSWPVPPAAGQRRFIFDLDSGRPVSEVFRATA